MPAILSLKGIFIRLKLLCLLEYERRIATLDIIYLKRSSMHSSIIDFFKI